MGAATVLLALNACSKEEAANRGTTPGGTFDVPKEAGIDEETSTSVLVDDTGLPVIDAQAHFLEYDLTKPLDPNFFGRGSPRPSAGRPTPGCCFGIDRFVETLYTQSETAVAVLSAVPAPDARTGELNIEVMDRARERIGQGVGSGKLLIHGLVVPTGRALSAALDDLEAIAKTYKVDGWKAYTTNTTGWRLDDGSLDVAPGGHGVAAEDRGAGHTPHLDPQGHLGRGQVGLAGRRRPGRRADPDVTIVVYHSGAETEVAEGPYDPAAAASTAGPLAGEAGIEPGGNVYAEIGWTWPGRWATPTRPPTCWASCWWRRRGPPPVGHRLDLGRLAAGPDPRVPLLRDHPAAPGADGYPALTPERKEKSSASTPPGCTASTCRPIEKRPLPPGPGPGVDHHHPEALRPSRDRVPRTSQPRNRRSRMSTALDAGHSTGCEYALRRDRQSRTGGTSA